MSKPVPVCFVQHFQVAPHHPLGFNLHNEVWTEWVGGGGGGRVSWWASVSASHFPSSQKLTGNIRPNHSMLRLKNYRTICIACRPTKQLNHP